MTIHSRLSPSARYRWQKCAASVEACLKYEGGGKSSPSAVDGTHSHTLLEHCIKKKVEPQTMLGLLMQDHDGQFGVEQDRIDRVNVALTYIYQRSQELGATITAEQRVDPAPLVGRTDMAGTVDVTLMNDDTLEIIDYKDGMGFVEAKDNPQMELYVFGVLARLENPTVKKIVTTIIQPKNAFKGLPPVSSAEYTIDDFMGPRLIQLMAEGDATDVKDAPFVPGDKQCMYCPNAGNCSAFNSWSLQRAGIKFQDMTVVKDAAAADPTVMTDEQLLEMVIAGPLIRKMIESAENEAYRRITTGHPVQGLKIVRNAGKRKWSMPEELIEEKLKKMMVPKSEIWHTTLVSPAQAEKMKWAKKNGEMKQLTPRQLEVLHNEMITKSEGSLTVVPEADNRTQLIMAICRRCFHL